MIVFNTNGLVSYILLKQKMYFPCFTVNTSGTLSATVAPVSHWTSNDSCSSSRAHCPWTARGPPVDPEQIRKKSQLPKTQCTYFDIFSRKTLNTWSNRSSFSQLQVHRLIEERGLSRSSCSGCARSSILAKFMKTYHLMCNTLPVGVADVDVM